MKLDAVAHDTPAPAYHLVIGAPEAKGRNWQALRCRAFGGKNGTDRVLEVDMTSKSRVDEAALARLT